MKEYNIPYIANLVVRAQSDDSDAFAELYALTYLKIYNYTRHYLRDDFLAQDALQEVYILALKNIKKLNDPSLFIAWLNRIAFNICYDISRKQKQENNCATDPDIIEIIEDNNLSINPEAHYQQKDDAKHLNNAIEQLPFHEKQVLIMRFYNNMKLEDIANAMSISRSSVKRYLASAQKTLKKILNE